MQFFGAYIPWIIYAQAFTKTSILHTLKFIPLVLITKVVNKVRASNTRGRENQETGKQ